MVRGPVTKTPPRSPRGQPPPEHRPGRPPRQHPIARTPKGEPMAQARTPEPIHAPKERGIGPPPNPRKPKLVRDVHGNELMDLFQLFPDLPRPPRRAPKLRRRLARRR
jgi:hypothetical protein